MSNIFDQELTIKPEGERVSPTHVSNASAILDFGNKAIEMGKNIAGSFIINETNKEFSEIDNQYVGGSDTDHKILKDTNNEVSKIKKAETQGKLTKTQARAKILAIQKQKIVDYPWLENDLKKSFNEHYGINGSRKIQDIFKEDVKWIDSSEGKQLLSYAKTYNIPFFDKDGNLLPKEVVARKITDVASLKASLKYKKDEIEMSKLDKEQAIHEFSNNFSQKILAKGDDGSDNFYKLVGVNRDFYKSLEQFSGDTAKLKENAIKLKADFKQRVLSNVNYDLLDPAVKKIIDSKIQENENLIDLSVDRYSGKLKQEDFDLQVKKTNMENKMIELEIGGYRNSKFYRDNYRLISESKTINLSEKSARIKELEEKAKRIYEERIASNRKILNKFNIQPSNKKDDLDIEQNNNIDIATSIENTINIISKQIDYNFKGINKKHPGANNIITNNSNLVGDNSNVYTFDSSLKSVVILDDDSIDDFTKIKPDSDIKFRNDLAPSALKTLSIGHKNQGEEIDFKERLDLINSLTRKESYEFYKNNPKIAGKLLQTLVKDDNLRTISAISRNISDKIDNLMKIEANDVHFKRKYDLYDTSVINYQRLKDSFRFNRDTGDLYVDLTNGLSGEEIALGKNVVNKIKKLRSYETIKNISNILKYTGGEDSKTRDEFLRFIETNSNIDTYGLIEEDKKNNGGK